ncbi:hypothetical protein BBP40_005455 [Aspergillus hancockii]|nr:hypothetical protein BBP40_005455 [Aspergillus hancockii]
MKKSREALLDKVGFNKGKGDHLILVGDLVNKGPDSPGIIGLAIELGASTVRVHSGGMVSCPAKQPGNPRVDLPSYTVLSDGPAKAGISMRHSATTYSTAIALSKRQLDWLAALPLILRIKLPHHPISFLGDTLAVVHAGLAPGITLEQQDPHSVMHIRSHVRTPGQKDGFIPAEISGEEGWAAKWDRWQDKLASQTTVIFGHDSKRRLQLGRHTVRPDSACVYGQQLSAVVI